ncbi:Protein ENHANCED DOWNY MILDEW 2, partial [Bienertia sinuspersici]
MESSDEEGEIIPDSLTDYEFLNQNNDHVSFAFLPLLWRKDEPVDSVNIRMFLSGVSVDGLQKIYKQAFAWRFELSYVQPEISVLCKGNHWVKLLKPKKLFEGAIRSILITIQCLHFVKHNPEATKNSIWCHLSRVFSSYEVAPSEIDCMNHISVIRSAAEQDRALMNSEFMLGIILEKPTNIKGKVLQVEGLPMKRDDFIDDEVFDDLCELDDSVDSEEDLFDTCCSLCDNGGDILCCEGRCMRSFHATEASGEGLCDSLGLSPSQAIPNFICKNCQYEQHQCFICGKLGSSDISSNPEVFPCIAASCGRFYHPRCVSKELHQLNNSQVEDLEKKIAAGESFVCPAHKCSVCKLVENREVDDLQFAVCRRCPKAYHRKCLPREITFEGDDEKGILQRAWDGLLIKRILIYCLNHEIDPELGTPQRDHIVFPGISKVRESNFKQRLTRVNVLPKKRKLIPYHVATEPVERKNEKDAAKAHYNSKGIVSTRPVGKGIIQPNSDAQGKVRLSNQTSASRDYVKLLSKPNALSTLTASKTVPEKSKLNPEKILKQNVLQSGTADKSWKKINAIHSARPLIKKQHCPSHVTDIKVEERINALIERVNSSFDVDKFMKQQIVPSNYKSSQSTIDKNLTKVKVEVTVKAVRAALQKLNNGGTVDDAKSVCSAEMLCQIPLWKKKLDVYLAPFLHGMSYSSYGRHFTKFEKLEE